MRLSLLLCASAAIWAGPADGARNEEIFNDKLKPLLAKHCVACHGAKGQSDLSLLTLEAALRGGKRGPALTPGDARKSLLVGYMRGQQNPRMPLGGAVDESVTEQIAVAIDGMKPVTTARNARQEWIFQKPAAPVVPSVKRPDWVRNPIDAFVLSGLEAKGMAPAARASKRALLRRVYFTLIGLPPSMDDVREFESDNSDNALEKVIDRLLADERYGERWGRHWLDLVRYAESDGFAIDGERPTAWRYRDYVIRAFNNDKPYDEFIKEQLAGDEGVRGGRRGAGEPSDSLLALGFLRMGPWEADANFDNQLRLDFLNDAASTTGQVFLGLTVGCARCHDHKYDPISQRDFYRMQAFFAATRVDDRPAPFGKAEDPARMRRLLRQYEDEVDESAAKLKEMEQTLRQKYADAKQLKPGDKKIGEFQKALNDKKDATYTAEERAAYEALRDGNRKVTELLARHQPLAYAVSEVAPPHVLEVAPTHILGGGQLNAKGDLVEPGFLKAIEGKEAAAKIPFVGRYRSGRRTALAEWIASPDNPLTARVMANRIWQHHFGEGIVRTPSDFGLNGDRPSHPELLDWLGAQFVDKKWSLKAMHKLMLLSNTWQQATSHSDAAKYAEADPENRLLWRMNWMRLEGEVIRDAILSVSGRLQPVRGGPGVFFEISPDMAQGFAFFKWFPSDEKDRLRRSVYHFQRRSVMNPMMEVFDGANMSESCSRRSVTTVPPQAFTLMNGSLTHTEAKHFAKRVIELAGPDQSRQIERAFQLALGRTPAADEKSEASKLYGKRQPEEALTRLGVVLFNLNEFLYLE